MADLKTELDVLAEENARLRIEREALEMVRAALQTIIDYENDCKAEGASLRLTYGEYDKAVDALAATAWNRRAQDVRGEAMVSVPREPTEKMMRAYLDYVWDRCEDNALNITCVWRAMLAAAGEPPKEPPPGACE